MPVRIAVGRPSRAPSKVIRSDAVVPVGGGVDEDAAGPRRTSGRRPGRAGRPLPARGSGRSARRPRPARAAIRSTRPLSRSVTRADPSGRKPMPQGTSRPCATVPTTRGGPVAVEGDDAVPEGAGLDGCGDAVVGSGPAEVVSNAPEEPPPHPARPTASPRAIAAVRTGRCSTRTSVASATRGPAGRAGARAPRRDAPSRRSGWRRDGRRTRRRSGRPRSACPRRTRGRPSGPRRTTSGR